MRRLLRLALGCVLIVHGLGNAVLPLRGVHATVAGAWAALPITLSSAAVIGFVAAGIGILGIRPLQRIAAAAAFAGGTGSIAAWILLGDRDLWPGIALDVALPMAAIAWQARVHAPEPATRTRATIARDVVGIAALVWIAVTTLLWPWTRTWGTTPHEWAISLPNDPASRNPAMELMHGVTIDAPPEKVWPWLIQLGQDRSGFYSYDWLERLFGADIHNTFELRPEWQTRTAGDRVPATQADYLGGVFGERPGWVVDRVDPGSVLVLRYWGAFVLRPTADGRTRFLIRSTISNRRIPAWAAALNFSLFELPHFIMERRMMLTIKRLSEQA